MGQKFVNWMGKVAIVLLTAKLGLVYSPTVAQAQVSDADLIQLRVSTSADSQISGASSLFNAANTWSLTLTAVAALVPEIAALALIYRRWLPEIT